MWLFTQYGFFSATKNDPDADGGVRDRSTIKLRARCRVHLVRLKEAFPTYIGACAIEHIPGRDYPFRILMPSEVFAELTMAVASSIDYGNFKNRLSTAWDSADGGAYHDAAMRVWSTMGQLQKSVEGFGPYGRAPSAMPAVAYPPDGDESARVKIPVRNRARGRK